MAIHRDLERFVGQSIIDGLNVLTAYASGKPFTLSLVWMRFQPHSGDFLAIGRNVTVAEAKELLLKPGMKHISDKGYEVYIYGSASYTRVDYVQKESSRCTVSFDNVDLESSFYRKIDCPSSLVDIDQRCIKTTHTSALSLLRNKEVKISKGEKVWITR